MRLLLFFTYGISLKTWDETGLIDREIILYKKLTEKGIKVSFITYGDKSDFKYSDKLRNVEIIPFYAFIKQPSNKILKFIQSFFLPFILRKYFKKVDIIKTNQMSTTWAPIIAKLLFKKKLIVRCGFEWYRFLRKKNPSLLVMFYMYITEYLSYHIANSIILTSEDDKQYIIRKFHISDSEKISVIPNYIDAEIFKPLADVSKKQDHLLFIGRLTEQKNLFNLLSALKGSHYTLDIVGDGKLKEPLMLFASENGIKVNFLGRLPNNEIPRLLNQYEVFVLPSLYEGNPKVLLEAMSCGLAVIGTNVEGINNIIKHKENGYLCEIDNQSIRDAINVVMKDQNFRKQMGNNARKHVIDYHSIDAALEKETDLYKTLLIK